jgi:hypothetical protein
MKPFTTVASSSKTPYRPVVLIVLASLSWADVALADESSGGGSGSASGPFRTGESAATTGGTTQSPFGYGSGSSSSSRSASAGNAAEQPMEGETAGAGAGTVNIDNNSSNFVAPSFYGRGPQVVTPGRGEFARPKFRYGASVGVGYDSNPNQLPDNNLPNVAESNDGSGFVWVNGHWDAQWIKPRTVFTMNVQGGGSFFFNNSDSAFYNGQLGAFFIHKFDPRTQVSGNLSFAYLSQPNYADLYASQANVAGDYITVSSKFDLSHRWTPLFSTTTSVSFNALQYTQSQANGLTNNYFNFIAGNEFRFHTSPRATWVLEGRYDMTDYYDNNSLNTQTGVFLGGVDWIMSRRLSASARVGGSVMSFDAGGSSASPYFEGSLNYLASRHSSVVLNARYGYQPTNVAGESNDAFRLGLLYQHAFTSRLSANAGFNFVQTNFNSNSSGGSTQDIYDLSAGLQYRLDRHFSLGARYNYTLQTTTTGQQDFDRNRVLFSGQYEY